MAKLNAYNSSLVAGVQTPLSGVLYSGFLRAYEEGRGDSEISAAEGRAIASVIRTLEASGAIVVAVEDESLKRSSEEWWIRRVIGPALGQRQKLLIRSDMTIKLGLLERKMSELLGITDSESALQWILVDCGVVESFGRESRAVGLLNLPLIASREETAGRCSML